MTRTTFRITILLLLLTCLLAAGVSAAVPSYSIDTTGFSIEDENTYYSLYKDSLMLPLNLTYESTTGITRMVITTSVEQNSGPVEGLTYTYELADGIPDNFAGDTEGKEYIYSITNINLNGTIPAALTVNITGLEVSPDPYTISMNIYAGDGTTDFDEVDINLDKDVNVYNFFIKSTVNNTETDPVWNLTNNLTVNTTILTSANLPAGTYTSPWEFTGITRGNDAFSTLLNPDNTTVTVRKQNGEDWTTSASTVSDTDGTISLTVDENDVGTGSYLLEFAGKRLGDVNDLYPTADSPVNIADVNMILMAWASYVAPDYDPEYIPAARLIYGDVSDDGLIDTDDATAVFIYIRTGTDNS